MDNPALVPFNPLPMARVEVTWGGYHAELPGGVAPDAAPADVIRMAAEAVRAGFEGMPADPGADLSGFKTERFEPTEARPWVLYLVRPGVAFGRGS